MSVTSLMTLGTSALASSYAALQTTGHNIANVNTAGYSRQQVELQNAEGQFFGAGYFGKGVNVTGIKRAHDEFLTREALAAQSLAAADSARLVNMTQLEKTFATGEAGLGYAAGQFINAFVDVASRPQDYAARQVALSHAQDVASRFRAAGQQIDSLQAGVAHDVTNMVNQVNSMAQSIASFNQEIAAVWGLGHPPNDLLDQREHLVREIGKLVQVTVIDADDGSQSMFIGGGQRLVLGGQALKLSVVPDTYDLSQVKISIRESDEDRRLLDNLIVGGSIAGLLRFQNTDLRDARNAIGQLAGALAGAVNEHQALGLDLSNPPGSGGPIFSVGPPRVLSAATNAKAADGSFIASYIDATGARVPSVGLTVVDSRELLASDYELRADPSGTPGSYELTRRMDGLVRTVVSGDVVDGLRIDVAAPVPAPTDRYLLQPLASAALDMKRVLDDPRGIAAASPVVGFAGQDNKGTAGIGSLRAVSAALDPTLRADISFSSDTGDFTWELRDRSSNALISTGAQTWTAGTPISLNGWELRLSGVPRSGDTLSVDTTAFPAANNGNAQALVALRDAALVGRQTLASGAILEGSTVTDAYANAMSDVGVRVQNAQGTAALSSSVANDAELRRTDISGVNLDEEAARLIQYQQSYQAAAKMLQVAQSVFDTLLQATRP